MPARPHIGVTPWRLPWSYEGTNRDKRIKRITIHFSPSGTSLTPPAYELVDFLIRWDKPFNIEDNAYGIIDERTTMWIPRHSIVRTRVGRTHKDFGRSGDGDNVDPEELWNLWQ